MLFKLKNNKVKLNVGEVAFMNGGRGGVIRGKCS